MNKFIVVIVSLLYLGFQKPVLAQTCNNCNGPGQTCIAGYCVEEPDRMAGSTAPAEWRLGTLLSRFFQFILPLIGILGFIFVMWSGFQYLMSKGDPKALAAAQARLTYAIIGLIIVSLAYSIYIFTTEFFGVTGAGGGGVGGP